MLDGESCPRWRWPSTAPTVTFMKIRHPLTLLVSLALLLAAASPAAAGPGIGYASDLETRWDQHMTVPALGADAAGLGFDVQGVAVDWEMVQRGNTKGGFDWAHYDKLRDELAPRGIRPVFRVMFTPLWAADLDEWSRFCGGTKTWRDCGYRLPPARNRMADWTEFVAALMERYADWRPLAVVVWNEANSSRYWKTGPDPSRYLDLLRATKAGVTAAGSTAPVTTGLSPARDSQTTRAELFLHDLYNLGASDAIDGIGTNLYASTNLDVDHQDNWFNQYLWWLRYVKWVHSADEPIWITESGYYTKTASGAPACQSSWVTEDFQADQLVRAIRHVRTMDDIASFLIHRPRDTGQPASCNPEHHFGLVRADGSRKPAWTAIQDELAAAPAG